MQHFQYLKTALRDYRIGAIAPSSSYVARRIAEEIGHECAYVVEYGPGDGAVTRAILQKLSPHGRMVVIERNPKFLPELRAIGDSRLHIVEGDIRIASKHLANLGLPQIDAVISSVPFSFFSPRDRGLIVERTFNALAPNGKFIVYQYSPLMLSHLRTFFGSVRMCLEPRNIPPYFIMVGEK